MHRLARTIALLRERRILGAALIVPVILLFLLLFSSRALSSVDYLWLDYLIHNYSDRREPDPRIVTVTISERTYDALGVKFPMPRKVFARYLEKVNRLGASVQALDIFFVPSIYESEEKMLAEKIRSLGNIICPVNTHETARGIIVEEPLNGRLTAGNSPLAHPNLLSDRNVVRQVRSYIRSGDTYYYCMALEALCLYGRQPLRIIPGDPPQKRRPWYLPSGGCVALGSNIYHLVGDRLYLNYFRPSADVLFESYDFEDIMKNDFPEGFFNGKIVLLGSRENYSHDIHPTPLGKRFGVEIHAVAMKNLMERDLLYPLNPIIIAGLICLFGFAGAVLLPKMRPLLAFAVFLLAAVSMFAAGALLFLNRIFLELACPVLTLAVSYIMASLFLSRALERELDVSMSYVERAKLEKRSAESLRSWLSSLLELTCRNMDAPVGWIQLRRDDGGCVLAASYNCEGAVSPQDLEKGVCTRTLAGGNPHLIKDLASEEEVSAFERRAGADTLLCVPLAGSEGIIGAVAVGKRLPLRFAENQLRQALVVSVLVGALIENINLNIGLEAKVIERTRELKEANERLVAMQAQLVKSEKLSAVGQLAAGIAHEINNPLAAILTNIQTFPETLTKDKVERRLAKLQEAVHRCKVIIEKLLNYSQRSEEERELDINGIIEECTAFLDAQMTRDGILLEKDLAATNPVFGNPAEISQLAINLIMNARDAVMAIEDANRRRIAVRTFERDAMVCLEVSDRGTGIAEEHLGRILDPFFSTKDIGKGPGLGLWVCHQIVKKHGGEIDVCSRPGEGCVFTVRLPAAIRSQ